MAIIYEGTNFDWATFVFNRLKDQIHKEINLSRTAPGKGLQKKGDFWERKSYGFPLQHLFNALKIKPTNLQSPHKSKTMFTYIKASLKHTPIAGSKRKKPEDSRSGVGRRTRSQKANVNTFQPGTSKLPEPVIISDENTSEEEKQQEDITYLEEGEEGYRLTSSEEEESTEEEAEPKDDKSEDGHFEEKSEDGHSEPGQENLEISDDELTLQEVLFKSFHKVDKQQSEPTNPTHFSEPVTTPIIDQGGTPADKEEEQKEEVEEKEEVVLEDKKEKEEDAVHMGQQEEDENKDAEEEDENEKEENNEDIDEAAQEDDPHRIFNLDIQPLIVDMGRQYHSRQCLKTVLRSDETTLHHKFEALLSHIKVQDEVMERQGDLICNLQHLIPFHVETNLDFHADKVDLKLKPLVDTINTHTYHIQRLNEIMEHSSKNLDLLLKVGAANNKILERKYGHLPDSDNVDADLEAFLNDAKKGEGGSKPESSSRKEASRAEKGKDNKESASGKKTMGSKGKTQASGSKK